MSCAGVLRRLFERSLAVHLYPLSGSIDGNITHIASAQAFDPDLTSPLHHLHIPEPHEILANFDFRSDGVMAPAATHPLLPDLSVLQHKYGLAGPAVKIAIDATLYYLSLIHI